MVPSEFTADHAADHETTIALIYYAGFESSSLLLTFLLTFQTYSTDRQVTVYDSLEVSASLANVASSSRVYYSCKSTDPER